MQLLVIRSLVTAIVVASVFTVTLRIATIRPIHEYLPGVSQEEMKAFDNKTVAEFESYLKSRQVQLTWTQTFRQFVRLPSFWRGMALSSAWSAIPAFFSAMLVGWMERRQALREAGRPDAMMRT